jgi:menaquinone-dependent protoporphyrinogen oxidase
LAEFLSVAERIVPNGTLARSGRPYRTTGGTTTMKSPATAQLPRSCRALRKEVAMRALVVYASAYGSTKGIAERIAQTLGNQGIDVQLKSASEHFVFESSDAFDGYVIGSAIHAGHWLRQAEEFVNDNADIIARRPSWLFSSGPIGDKAVEMEQPEPKVVGEFRKKIDVRDHVVFAGAFDPAKADWTDTGWLEKVIAKRFIPVGDFREWDKIEAWALQIAHELVTGLVPA